MHYFQTFTAEIIVTWNQWDHKGYSEFHILPLLFRLSGKKDPKDSEKKPKKKDKSKEVGKNGSKKVKSKGKKNKKNKQE